MPLQITICRLCIRSRPDVLRMVAQLAAAFPEKLIVVELECMAACDDVPAVMIETDYFPQVTPPGLERAVRERLIPA
ncbi:MAG: NAD(P)H-dependent oxidoreductase subunit E [Chloroflexi bacterium OHK40]